MKQGQWDELKRKLVRSKFRRRFHLSRSDIDYINSKGIETIERHCRDFIVRRLSPARPTNDGRQTPMRGHPVFTAQHSTAVCCRKCLAKWHAVPTGHELTDAQIDRICEIIMLWISDQLAAAARP